MPLLPKSAFEHLLEISGKLDEYKLKDMKKEKPSRTKTNRQLTQNQVRKINNSESVFNL